MQKKTVWSIAVTCEELAALIREDGAKWSRIIAEKQIKPE